MMKIFLRLYSIVTDINIKKNIYILGCQLVQMAACPTFSMTEDSWISVTSIYTRYVHTPTFAIINPTEVYYGSIIFCTFCFICLASVSIT